MPKHSITKKLVILDRDGVINLDSDDYVKSSDEWIPIDSSLRAIAKLNKAGYLVAIATNQSGISRGYFDEIELSLMHKKMELLLANVGGHIDAIEYCPDHPDNPGPNRKPNPGMLNKLLEKFGVSDSNTWFVGDSISDIQCAIRGNCKPVLVLTGKGRKTISHAELPENTLVYQNLADFVDHFVAQ